MVPLQVPCLDVRRPVAMSRQKVVFYCTALYTTDHNARRRHSTVPSVLYRILRRLCQSAYRFGSASTLIGKAK